MSGRAFYGKFQGALYREPLRLMRQIGPLALDEFGKMGLDRYAVISVTAVLMSGRAFPK